MPAPFRTQEPAFPGARPHPPPRFPAARLRTGDGAIAGLRPYAGEGVGPAPSKESGPLRPRLTMLLKSLVSLMVTWLA
jgi:hypothetical protein